MTSKWDSRSLIPKMRLIRLRASDSTCSTAARVTSFRHSFIHSKLTNVSETLRYPLRYSDQIRRNTSKITFAADYSWVFGLYGPQHHWSTPNKTRRLDDVSKVTIDDRKQKVAYLTSTEIDDLEWYTFAFAENFAGFRRFWRQQLLNEWR